MATFEATGVSMTDTGLTVSARDFQWVVDEPPMLGGGDLGPNPVEYVLGALLGCLNVVCHLVAKEQGVVLTSFTAHAKGELDPTKFMGKNMDVRAGYSVIDVTIDVESEADQATLDEIVAIAETRCPVSDNLANATPINIKMIKKA